ncbi:TIGR03087 family PEP-CTERM/XrtA system glycosyltransferase [Duganella aceris]|uniref:TIGR03087 family PEP-CTERM/XrtA system glycosyltransferase n=1 Tax=Duganella aceris TaxID=2703883 RepID=A0ABX0FR19_9BURK|nr:TIGR03087 family PEP-CTERM/XrtA system glycosyltransferase [Duganella aceris]NGZ87096.1 TIGR03087 family PEP-CTERM/XrtA system glycosyltransferase [Duganella aceris]
MRDLLFLTHRLPYPPNKGERIRAYHALQYLVRHFRVHLGSFIDHDDELPFAERLAADCADSCIVRLPANRARLAGVIALMRGEALSLPYFRHAALRCWVDRTLEQYPAMPCLAFSGPMAQYLTRPQSLRVMDLVDVDSEKWHDYADRNRWPMSWLYRREGRLLLEHERRVAADFKQVLLVSPAEAALFKQRAPESSHKIDYYNNGVDSEYFSPLGHHPNPYGEAPVLVFTGTMDYRPNIDAVTWFAERVMPPLRQRFADLQFHIVGSRPTGAVLGLRRVPGVHVSGAVPDIRPYLRHATLVVAPLQVARGVQNKVLEAMAMQKTIIATPQALEGISAVPGVEVIGADGADEFIRHISHQLTSFDDFGLAARRRILLDYNWERNLQRLGRVLGIPGTSVASADAEQRASTISAEPGS